jgi:integrase
MASQRRDKGTGTIFRRADGTYIGGIEIPTTDGKRRRKTVSSKRRDIVVRRLRQLRKDIDAGRVTSAPSVTVARYLHDWLKLVVAPHAAPKTYAWYEQAVRLHITPYIGAKRLEKLVPADIRMLHELVAENASTSSAQQAHVTLRTALSRAVKDGVLSRNVAEIAGKPGHDAKERGHYTSKQAKTIIGAAIATGDDMFAARVIAAFFTGARPAELLGLRWQYVDLKTGTITLAWQLQHLPSEHGCESVGPGHWSCGKKRGVDCPQARFRLPRGFRYEPCTGSLAFKEVKTKNVHVVPLAAPLWAVLRQLSQTDSTNPYDLVFHHPDGRPIQPKADYHAFKDLLANITGLPANAVPYSSRHTTATLMRELGISDETARSIMGHSTAVAHAGYVHYDQTEDNRAALASLTELLKGN